jgi:hypothetical protein
MTAPHARMGIKGFKPYIGIGVLSSGLPKRGGTSVPPLLAGAAHSRQNAF